MFEPVHVHVFPWSSVNVLPLVVPNFLELDNVSVAVVPHTFPTPRVKRTHRTAAILAKRVAKCDVKCEVKCERVNIGSISSRLRVNVEPTTRDKLESIIRFVRVKFVIIAKCIFFVCKMGFVPHMYTRYARVWLNWAAKVLLFM